MLRVTYEPFPDNYLFLPPVEWNIIEINTTDNLRAKYAQIGYPQVEIDGEVYNYLPVMIEDKTFCVIRGSRPVSRRLEDD